MPELSSPSGATRPARPARQRRSHLLRLAIGLGLLGLLFAKIPWRDRVVLTAADGTVRELPVEPVRAEASGEADRRLDPVLLLGAGEARGWSFQLEREGSALAAVTPAPGEDQQLWGGASGSYQPGLGGSLRRLSLAGFLVASLLALLGTVTASMRWKVLLGAVDIQVPLARAVRLNLAGLAASQVLLGSVGGDIVKGALVTRDAAVPAELGARTSAVLALMMDRIVGLAALLTIGTAAAYLVDGNAGELATWFGLALALLLTGVVGVLIVADRFDFPSGQTVVWRVLHSLHATLARYRRRPGALAAGLLLSFGSHSFLIAAIASLGAALGMQVDATRFFLLIPIIETAQAVPVSPAGWGVAESLYVVLFQEAGETATLALSLALSVRAVTLSQALLGLPGLVVLLRRRRAAEEGGRPPENPLRGSAPPHLVEAE